MAPVPSIATRAWVITPSDSTGDVPSGETSSNPALSYARWLRCSADCQLKVTTTGGDTLIMDFFKGDNAISLVQIFATGSTLNGARLYGLY